MVKLQGVYEEIKSEVSVVRFFGFVLSWPLLVFAICWFCFIYGIFASYVEC